MGQGETGCGGIISDAAEHVCSGTREARSGTKRHPPGRRPSPSSLPLFSILVRLSLPVPFISGSYNLSAMDWSHCQHESPCSRANDCLIKSWTNKDRRDPQWQHMVLLGRTTALAYCWDCVLRNEANSSSAKRGWVSTALHLFCGFYIRILRSSSVVAPVVVVPRRHRCAQKNVVLH